MGNRTNLAEASAKGAEANRPAADAFAANVLPIIRQIVASGVRGSRAVAATSVARGAHRAQRGLARHDGAKPHDKAGLGATSAPCWYAGASGVHEVGEAGDSSDCGKGMKRVQTERKP